jgi:hypothetical protein
VNATRLLKAAVIGIWVVMVGLLIYKNYSTPSADRISFASVKDTLAVGEEWMGIYLKEEKVGYAVTLTQRVGDSYEIFEHALMHLTMMGTKQRIESRLKTFVNLDFQLQSFNFTLSSGPVRFSLQGEVSGKSINLTMASGKERTETVLELDEIPYLSNSIKPYVVKHGLEVGKAYSLPFFDPSTMSSSTINVDVLGKEKIVHSGNLVTAYRLKESFKGIETLVWVSEAGETLKEESPLGLSLVRETQEAALSGEWMKGTKPDLVLLTAIPTTTPISNPRETKQLTINLGNVPVEEFDLDGGRQRLEGTTVEIRQEDPFSWETFSLPSRNENLEEYIKPTPLIQSGDDKIIRLAAKITKGSRDAEESSRKLLDWVYTKLEKKPTMSIPSALEVLDIMAGDCNEHTALFTALSRSLGIPTRVCVGVVYMQKSFYYHAWPEIFLGEWVAVDPTFNQFPADATHIRFVVGDLSDQIKILKIVSQIKLEILEYS